MVLYNLFHDLQVTEEDVQDYVTFQNKLKEMIKKYK